MLLARIPGTVPSGNLQAEILFLVTTDDFSSVALGSTTVPMLGVGGVGADNCIRPNVTLTGTDFQSDLEILYPDGRTTLANLFYSWAHSALRLDHVALASQELRVFEATCGAWKRRETAFLTASCGSEALVNEAAFMPQIFVESLGYWASTPGTHLLDIRLSLNPNPNPNSPEPKHKPEPHLTLRSKPNSNPKRSPPNAA